MTAKQSEQRIVENIMKLADEYATIRLHAVARAALLAAVEELVKDAERYQFLRDSGWNECSHPEVWRQIVNEYDGLDEAIDAAMKGQS